MGSATGSGRFIGSGGGVARACPDIDAEEDTDASTGADVDAYEGTVASVGAGAVACVDTDAFEGAAESAGAGDGARAGTGDGARTGPGDGAREGGGGVGASVLRVACVGGVFTRAWLGVRARGCVGVRVRGGCGEGEGRDLVGVGSRFWGGDCEYLDGVGDL